MRGEGAEWTFQKNCLNPFFKYSKIHHIKCHLKNQDTCLSLNKMEPGKLCILFYKVKNEPHSDSFVSIHHLSLPQMSQ